MSDHVELIEIHPLPRDLRVPVERRLLFLAGGVYRRVDLLERAAFGVSDDSRPGFIGLPDGDGVGMTSPAIAS